ncbi:MAG: sigma-70 family RNA polymerase sigma factor [Acidobacteriota bacterium]
MEHLHLGLLDSNGKPLTERIQGALTRLLPRLRRQFPALQDDVALTEVMEEAGRRITRREERGGPLEKLHGYAWVTIRSVATSRMRRGSSRLIQKTLEPEASHAKLAAVPAASGTAEEVERAILLREVLDKLTPEERLVCIWKKAGWSSQEIAEHQGRSVTAVDTLFSRAKAKLRKALGVQDKEPHKTARP